MRLAIVAVLAVTGLAINTVNANHPTFYTAAEWPFSYDCISDPESETTHIRVWMDDENLFGYNITSKHTIGENTFNHTSVLPPVRFGSDTQAYPTGDGTCKTEIIDVKHYNVTDAVITALMIELNRTYNALNDYWGNPNYPETEFSGIVYNDQLFYNNSTNRIPNIEVIAVNMANHTDVKRDTTDRHGRYSIDVEPGGYLIQAIGGGPDAYRYMDINENQRQTINLRYD